jgi:hypothetical protein
MEQPHAESLHPAYEGKGIQDNARLARNARPRLAGNQDSQYQSPQHKALPVRGRTLRLASIGLPTEECQHCIQPLSVVGLEETDKVLDSVVSGLLRCRSANQDIFDDLVAPATRNDVRTFSVS